MNLANVPGGRKGGSRKVGKEGLSATVWSNERCSRSYRYLKPSSDERAVHILRKHTLRRKRSAAVYITMRGKPRRERRATLCRIMTRMQDTKTSLTKRCEQLTHAHLAKRIVALPIVRAPVRSICDERSLHINNQQGNATSSTGIL